MKMVVEAQKVLDFLAGNMAVVTKFKLAEKLYITIFDYSYLLAGVYMTQNINHNLYIIKQFVSQNMEILYYEQKEANLFAKLKSVYNDVDDLILMKCAILQTNSLPIYTDKPIYEKIKKIKIIKEENDF